MNVSEIHGQYAARVYNLCLTVLRDSASAEDATQETFIEVLRTKSPPVTGNFRAWLYQIAYRTALRTRRKSQAFAALPSQLPTEDSMQDRMLLDEQISRLRKEIDALDPTLKEPLVLRYQHDLSFREIATVLDEPEGTVSRRVYEARQELKQRLAAVAIIPTSLEALLPQIPMAAVPPSLMRRLAKPATPAAVPLLWSLLAASAGILLILTFAARKHAEPESRVRTATNRTHSEPAVVQIPDGDIGATIRTATPHDPPRVTTAKIRLIVTDLPEAEAELQVLHKINLATFRDVPGGRPEIRQASDGLFEADVPCTESSLFQINKWRQGFLSAPWTRWAIARPGETVTIDMNYGDVDREPEAKDLLLAEMARLGTFGGVRATFNDPGELAKIAFRFKGEPLFERSWPMLFWEGDRFLLLPLPPGAAEFKLIDACCEHDFAAQINASEIAEGGRLEHRPMSTSSLSGVVLDPAGRPFSSARLEISDDSGRHYTTVSDDAGRFTFEKLAMGLKNPMMSIQAEGYPIRVNVAVALNQQDLVVQLQQMLRHRFQITDAPEGLAVVVREFEAVGPGRLEIDASAWELSRVGEVPPTFEVRVDFAKAPKVAKVRLMITAPGYYGLDLGTYLTDGGLTTVPIENLQKKTAKDR